MAREVMIRVPEMSTVRINPAIQLGNEVDSVQVLLIQGDPEIVNAAFLTAQSAIADRFAQFRRTAVEAPCHGCGGGVAA